MEMERFEHHLLLEYMRNTIRYAVGTCGCPRSMLAGQIGVSDGTVKHLLDGGDIKSDTWDRVWAWCERYEFENAYVEQAALSVLVAAMPLRVRPRVRERMVRHLRAAVLRTEEPYPEWMIVEMNGWKANTKYRRQQHRLRPME
jgi:hypothetical protein